MQMKNPFLVMLSSLLIVFGLAGCGKASSNYEQATPATEQLNQGKPAPMFHLKDMSGRTVKLEEFQGEKVYVKYWASWCSICLAGLDDLDTLAGKETNFHIITIVNPNYNGEMPPKKFKKWFSSLSTKNLTVLLDTDGKWANKFGLLAYPTSYYIGSDGILVQEVAGHNTNEVIKGTMASIE